MSYPTISEEATLTGAVPVFDGLGLTVAFARAVGVGEGDNRARGEVLTEGEGDGVRGVSFGVDDGDTEGSAVSLVGLAKLCGDSFTVGIGEDEGSGVCDGDRDGDGEGVLAGVAVGRGERDALGRGDALGDGEGVEEGFLVVPFFFFFGAGVGVPVINSFTLLKKSFEAALRSAVTAKVITKAKQSRKNCLIPFVPPVTRQAPLKRPCSCEFLLPGFQPGNSR